MTWMPKLIILKRRGLKWHWTVRTLDGYDISSSAWRRRTASADLLATLAIMEDEANGVDAALGPEGAS